MQRPLLRCLSVLLALAWCAQPAVADEKKQAFGKSLGFRVSAETGVMVSRDQLEKLGYDHYGWLGDLHLVHAPLPWLDLQLGVLAGMFPASHGYPPGGVVSPLAGVLVHTSSKRLSPYAFFDLGPAFTGESVRPMIRLGAGIDLGIRRGVRMGPVFGYARITQRDGPGLSQDAAFLWVGISVSYHPEPPPPPRPRHVTVVQHVHQHVSAPPVIIQQNLVTQTTDEELGLLLENALPSPVERIEIIAPILFAFDSDVPDKQGTATLHEVARLLTERSEFALISIEGYSDERGSAEYNQALARRRAEKVRGWLVEHGIVAERLTLRAEGANHPVEKGQLESAHAQNRRVVFRVLRKVKP